MPIQSTLTASPENRFPRRGTFNVEELAEFLGVSTATVRRMDASGRLPRPVRFNRAVRWDRWTIEEWLAAGAPPRDEGDAAQPSE